MSRPSAEAPVLTVRRVDSLAGGLPLSGSLASWGLWKREGDELLVHVPDEPVAFDAVLRLAWQIVTLQLGGLLLHSSGTCIDGQAFVATGISTAGKTTLAHLCIDAGAKLLSDEIIQLFPDGTCWGTPFRSDPTLSGRVECARVARLATLVKGDHEALRTPDPLRFVRDVIEQVYVHPGLELPRTELNRRALAIIGATTPAELTFRKHPDAGRFVVETLRGHVAPAP